MMNFLPLNFRVLALIVYGVVSFLTISETGKPVPHEFWKELWAMNLTEFRLKYTNEETNLGSFSERGETQQGNAPAVAGMQGDPVIPCYPMNTSVELPADPDPSIVRIPPCTVLPRCGGCCGSASAIKCLPTSTNKVQVTVYRGFFDGTKMNFTQETLQMDVHTACGCECSIKPSDCHKDTQIYDSSECACKCKNENEATTCTSPKIWDERSCSCVCPHLQNCLADEVFSFRTCACEPQTAGNSPANLEAGTPCQSVTCRPGYKAVLVSGKCLCQPSPSG